jgi:hypothetical protein
MSRIAAVGFARKKSSSGTANLFVTRCVLCVGARKHFVTSTVSERNYLQGNTDKILLKGTELTIGVDVTAPGLGMDAAASLRVFVAGFLDLGRARGRSGRRGRVVWGCGGVVGATRGGLVIRRWCLHAW